MKRSERFPNTATFRYHNQNPKNRITGDCVFRAISLATGKSYNECVMEMARLMCETGYALNDVKGMDAYFKHIGWIKMPQPRKPDGKKYTGSEWCAKFKGTCVADIGGHHTVCIKDGSVWDTWNSTGGCIGSYWVKKN